MKTKLHSSFIIHHSAFALLAVITLCTVPPRAPAQTSWGNALSFDGADDFVDLGTGGPVLGTNFTEEAWIKPQVTDNYYHGILGYQPPTGIYYRSPCMYVYQKTKLQVGYGSGSAWVAYETTNVLQLNAWNHVAATYDGNDYRVYVNGQPVFSTSTTAVPSSTPVRHIGQVNTDFFKGVIDEVRLWSRARTQAEIQANMLHPLTGTENNLVAYWRFDEGAGVTAYDATPNHRNGTLINRPLRAASYWSPVVTLNSPNPMTNECHVPFVDPTTVNASAVAIAAGEGHNLALRPDGTVAAWGLNDYGQANIPSGLNSVVAIAAGGIHSLVLKAGGTVVAWGDNYYDQTSIPSGLNSVVAIAAGGIHNLGLKADGTVVAWGNNWYGQTNIPSGLNSVVAIAAGRYHSLALKANGTVVGWGNNERGQISIPSWLNSVVAIAAGNYHSLALKADGTVVGWGENMDGQANPPSGLTGVVAIAAGYDHSLALKADGAVICWGADWYGVTDIPASATNVVAVAASGYFGLALRADGAVICWGSESADGYYHRITTPASVYQLSLPLGVSGAVNPNSVGSYSLTYSTTNAIGAIGTGARSVVVTDTLPPVVTLRGDNRLMVNRGSSFVDPGATAADLCTGDLTGSVVSNLTVNTSISGAYTNTFTVADASGNVATAARTVVVGAPIVITLPATNLINDAATLTGTVNPNGGPTAAWFEWRSAYDQVYNTTAPQSIGTGTNAVPVSATLSGLSPGMMYYYRLAATNSPWVARGTSRSFSSPNVDLQGPGFLTLQLGAPFVDPTRVIACPLAIATGPYHSLALRGDGRVVGWGYNSYGQTNSPSLATNVVAIAAGSYHSLALRGDGRVVGWGYGYHGQTNSPASATNVVAIAAGRIHSLALRGDGRVVGWGYNYYGQTNSPSLATNVVAIAACSYHSLALRGDGRVVGWGFNDFGQATGVPTPQSESATGLVVVAGQTLTNAVAIAAGPRHSLALKVNGTVVGWGDDSYGQISIPSGLTDAVAIAAGGDQSLALRADGTLVAWGGNNCGQGTVPANVSNVVAIAAAGYVDTVEIETRFGNNLVVQADGTIVGWGCRNEYGAPVAVPTDANVLNVLLYVSGAVNTNVLGTYVLNYSTTNELGAIGTATRIVVVATQPIVTTEPATALGPTGATLQGTVNPRASQTLAWFEYGLGANYGNETPGMPMGNATNAEPFGISVTGLPWMTYHYRAVASNDLGRVEGPDATFTLPGPSMVAPSLSALSDLTLPQGGSTSVSFTVSPTAVDVRVRCNNPILLPSGALTVNGSGTSRSLDLVPAFNHSGSAQVTVIASDGTRSASRTFTLTVTPAAEYHSPLLYLTEARVVSPQAWRFRIVDAGTGSTNYAVEYRSSLSPTNAWMPATNVTPLGGGVFEVGIGPPQQGLGFYRGKGFRLLLAGFDSAEATAEEGAGTVGPVVVFNGIYVGTVTCIGSGAQGATWTNQVQVNGTTAVIPIPASFLADNSGIGQLQHLTLRLEGGAGFGLGPIAESTVAIEENDTHWRGVLESTSGSLGFMLTLRQTNGSAWGQIQSEGFGFFPTNALVQLTFREDSFAAVAANACLPVLTGYPSISFTNYVDFRLDAANGPGRTNVSPTQVQGVATLVSKVPGRPDLDSAVSGTFLLLKAPTAPSTNEVPLYPAP